MPKRRRGSRSGRLRPPSLPARHRRFEDLVAIALAEIPMPFAAALDEVAIVIEDEPTPEQLRENELEPDDTLYGLYAAPNRISLFRLPLEADFADPDELAEEVRITVIHELAHHLGIDDDRLHDLGAD